MSMRLDEATDPGVRTAGVGSPTGVAPTAATTTPAAPAPGAASAATANSLEVNFDPGKGPAQQQMLAPGEVPVKSGSTGKTKNVKGGKDTMEELKNLHIEVLMNRRREKKLDLKAELTYKARMKKAELDGHKDRTLKRVLGNDRLRMAKRKEAIKDGQLVRGAASAAVKRNATLAGGATPRGGHAPAAASHVDNPGQTSMAAPVNDAPEAAAPENAAPTAGGGMGGGAGGLE